MLDEKHRRDTIQNEALADQAIQDIATISERKATRRRLLKQAGRIAAIGALAFLGLAGR